MATKKNNPEAVDPHAVLVRTMKLSPGTLRRVAKAINVSFLFAMRAAGLTATQAEGVFRNLKPLKADPRPEGELAINDDTWSTLFPRIMGNIDTVGTTTGRIASTDAPNEANTPKERTPPVTMLGFAHFKDGTFDLIVRDRETHREVTLHGTITEEQGREVEYILPMCVFIDAAPEPDPTDHWQQGYLLDTPTTRKWRPSERAMAQADEKRRVFRKFSHRDQGQSREAVAEFRSADDARRAVASVNALAGVPVEELERVALLPPTERNAALATLFANRMAEDLRTLVRETAALVRGADKPFADGDAVEGDF